MRKEEKEKEFCPACGSTHIALNEGKYVCSDCKAIFGKPKRTRVRLRKKPRYIG